MTRICRPLVDNSFVPVHPQSDFSDVELSFWVGHVITIKRLSFMASSSRRRIVSEEPDDVASGKFTSVS